MWSEKSVAEIACRFGIERHEINQYVRFIAEKSAIHDHEIVELSAMLQRHGLPELPTRDYPDVEQHLREQEIRDLAKEVDRVKPLVEGALHEQVQKVDAIPFLEDRDVITEHPGLFNEWTEYMLERIPENATSDVYGALEHETLAEADAECIEDELSAEDRNVLVREAIKRARYVKARTKANELHYALDRFKDVKIIAKATEPNAVAGVFRQGFILLMTAFDAAVFDLRPRRAQEEFLRSDRCFW
jgi:hypothetical protein